MTPAWRRPAMTPAAFGWLLAGIGLVVVAIVSLGGFEKGRHASEANAASAPAARATAQALAVDGRPSPTPPLPASAVTASRYRLQGIVAAAAPDAADGVALIALDDAPARGYRTGDAVGGDLILLGISPGGAILGARNGAPALVLTVSASVLASDHRPVGAATGGSVALPDADLSPSDSVASSTARPGLGRRLRLRHPSTGP